MNGAQSSSNFNMLQYKMNRGQPATAGQQYINQEDVRNFVPGK